MNLCFKNKSNIIQASDVSMHTLRFNSHINKLLYSNFLLANVYDTHASLRTRALLLA